MAADRRLTSDVGGDRRPMAPGLTAAAARDGPADEQSTATSRRRHHGRRPISRNDDEDGGRAATKLTNPTKSRFCVIRIIYIFTRIVTQNETFNT